MGKTRSRVTGICLSLTVTLLGAGTTVLLYYAGQEGIELLYDHTYIDDQGSINRRMPTDDWYGSLIMRAWAFGFIYIVPGLLGIAASFFFNKCMIGCVGVLEVICLIVGSFVYSCGTMSIIIYRYFFLKYPRNSPWLGDCIYVIDSTIDLVEYVDQRCMTGRRMLMICIAACGVSFLAWGMLLAKLIYNSCIFHSAVKEKSKSATGTPSLSNVNRKRQSQRPTYEMLRRRKQPSNYHLMEELSRDTDDEPGTSSRIPGQVPKDLDPLHLPTTSDNQETISSPVASMHDVLHDADTHHSEDETCGNKVPDDNCPQVISGQDNPSFHHDDDTDDEPGTSSRGKALQSSPRPIPEDIDSLHLPTTSNNQETISSAVAPLNVVLHDAHTHLSEDEFEDQYWGI